MRSMWRSVKKAQRERHMHSVRYVLGSSALVLSLSLRRLANTHTERIAHMCEMCVHERTSDAQLMRAIRTFIAAVCFFPLFLVRMFACVNECLYIVRCLFAQHSVRLDSGQSTGLCIGRNIITSACGSLCDRSALLDVDTEPE